MWIYFGSLAAMIIAVGHLKMYCLLLEMSKELEEVRKQKQRLDLQIVIPASAIQEAVSAHLRNELGH